MYFQADPALLRLPAPALRGTFSRAYSLLAKLVSQIGWDELLKTRSIVFVMEEEYRMQKVQADVRSAGPDQQTHPNGVIHEDGTVEYTNGHGGDTLPTPTPGGADDHASTRAIVGSSIDASATPEAEKPVITDEFDEGSDGEAVDGEEFAKGVPSLANGNGNGHTDEKEDGLQSVDDASTLQSTAADDLERPSLAAMKEEDEEADSKAQAPPPQDYSFSNKRLCERWLDNLFMVLYEVC